MAKNLTTTDNVRLLLQEDSDKRNDIIDYLIPVASDAIRSETGRLFTIPPVVEDRQVLIYRDRIVYLDEINEITAVLDANGLAMAYETLPESSIPKRGEYLLIAQPVDASKLPPMHADLFTVNLNGPYPQGYNSWPLRVRVYGNWGWAKVPKEIDYLCARTVQLWYKGGIAEFTQTYALGGPVDQFVVPDRLPTAVIKGLKSWKKPRGRK